MQGREGGGWTGEESRLHTRYFGGWGAAGAEVGAVGGNGSGGDNDAIAHFDGEAWTRREDVPGPFGVPYFKVWGSAADDVFAVGQSGLVAHFDGKTWTQQESGTRALLFTVHGSGPDDVYAVGGLVGPPAVLHFDGEAWSAITNEWIACGPVANGVHVDPGGDTRVVGMSGLRWRLADGAWRDECAREPPLADLHAVWGDGAGGAFAVGGNYMTECGSACMGVIEHYGVSHPDAP